MQSYSALKFEKTGGDPLKRVARLRVKIIEFSDTKLRFALLAQQFLAKFVKIMTIFRAI